MKWLHTSDNQKREILKEAREVKLKEEIKECTF